MLGLLTQSAEMLMLLHSDNFIYIAAIVDTLPARIVQSIEFAVSLKKEKRLFGSLGFCTM